MNNSVRVRYAPSPTGYLHVGGLRTLLFNWFYAKKTGGTLVLRVEDTDQARSTRQNEEMLLKDVDACGIDYQEGPSCGGPFPPYRQSERLAIYAKHARELLDAGKAFYCFCSDEVIGQKREAAMKMGRPPVYDGTCARLSKDDVQARFANGDKAGVRFKAPTHKSFICDDIVRGRVEFKEGTVGDFLITRTPGTGEQEIAEGIGMPVYNFCCVIDDHLMQMSHIIRGEDHLSNTARQLMLYDAFGWELPKFAHMAMVLGGDRQKLSKRNGDVSVSEYLDKGYMPEALLNFMALLGWWPPNDYKPKSGHPEILTIAEMIQTFSLEGLQKSPAVFDVQKLQWMNSYYMRALPIEDAVKRAEPYLEELAPAELKTWLQERGSEVLAQAVDLVRAEASLLNEIPAGIWKLVDPNPPVEADALQWLRAPEGEKLGAALVEFLNANPKFATAEGVDAMQKSLMATTGLKGKPFFMSLRSWLTGQTHGPELKKVIPLLGEARVQERVQWVQSQK